MKSYKQKNYEQALIETYLKFDELLRLEKVNQFLKNNMMSKQNSRLDITFSSTLQSDSSSNPVNFVEIMRNEEVKIKKIEIFEKIQFKEKLWTQVLEKIT